ncbi:MAG TPA: GIY-YIG nuclease family protein [Candidatus Thermoplasmatota archaeon]|nr:GIY-YIG nuclease family protein [Candidatus Thermoplasmatota archaeon]
MEEAAPCGVVWTVYLLRCRDGTLYCGVATDVEKRVAAHAAGKGARYTRGRGPFEVVWTEPHATRGAALAREAAVKRLPRRSKLALARLTP